MSKCNSTSVGSSRFLSSNGAGGGGWRTRTHVVSIANGDYADYNDFDDEDDDGKGWDLDKAFNPDLSQQNERDREAHASLLEADRDQEAQRRKWIEGSKRPVRVPVIDERGRAHGRGGRKSSTASVFLYPGEGNITVNDMDFVEYFPRDSLRENILGPFVATRTCGAFDVTCKVHGGGKSGQAGAVRHGIARALQNYNPDEYRPPMKALGFMTRDPRKVERKKIGLKKARKAPQWVKR